MKWSGMEREPLLQMSPQGISRSPLSLSQHQGCVSGICWEDGIANDTSISTACLIVSTTRTKLWPFAHPSVGSYRVLTLSSWACIPMLILSLAKRTSPCQPSKSANRPCKVPLELPSMVTPCSQFITTLIKILQMMSAGKAVSMWLMTEKASTLTSPVSSLFLLTSSKS